MQQTTAGAQTQKTPFAKLRSEFVMSNEEINFLKGLPENLPETKLSQKQKDGVQTLYVKYISNKVYKGWGQDLACIEQKEKWPSGPRVKRHEAQRFILGNLLELNTHRAELTAEQAATKFFNSLTCRETYTILLSKVYEVQYKY